MTADDLEALRIAVGHTRAEAAELVHVTDRAWRHWEAGTRGVDQTAAHLYCLLVGVEYPWRAEEHLVDAS